MKIKKSTKNMLVGIFALVGIGIVVRYFMTRASKKSPVTGSNGKVTMLMPPQTIFPTIAPTTIRAVAPAPVKNID